MPESAPKKNGNTIKDPKLILALGVSLISVAGAFFSLRTSVGDISRTLEKDNKNLQRQIDCKVDENEYRECVKRIDTSISSVQASQVRIEGKIDKIPIPGGS